MPAKTFPKQWLSSIYTFHKMATTAYKCEGGGGGGGDKYVLRHILFLQKHV